MRTETMGIVAILLSANICFSACATEPPIQKQEEPSAEVVVKVNRIENADRFQLFYRHYLQGQQDHVKIIAYTDEGDPISTDVQMQGEALNVTFDNSQDKFGGAKRGKQTFTCAKIAQVKRIKGNVDYELQGCTGHDDQLGDSVFLLRLPLK